MTSNCEMGFCFVFFAVVRVTDNNTLQLHFSSAFKEALKNKTTLLTRSFLHLEGETHLSGTQLFSSAAQTLTLYFSGYTLALHTNVWGQFEESAARRHFETVEEVHLLYSSAKSFLEGICNIYWNSLSGFSSAKTGSNNCLMFRSEGSFLLTPYRM